MNRAVQFFSLANWTKKNNRQTLCLKVCEYIEFHSESMSKKVPLKYYTYELYHIQENIQFLQMMQIQITQSVDQTL